MRKKKISKIRNSESSLKWDEPQGEVNDLHQVTSAFMPSHNASFFSFSKFISINCKQKEIFRGSASFIGNSNTQFDLDALRLIGAWSHEQSRGGKPVFNPVISFGNRLFRKWDFPRSQ